MKQQKHKRLIAFIMLYTLIGLALILTYIKFFTADNNKITEIPVNESSSNAIHTALKEITNNFNESTKVKDYANDNDITLKASINNYSLYISYIAETTTTYEFSYKDLSLNITISNNDKEKFNEIYRLLIEAVQKRINNTTDITSFIDDFLNNDKNFDGLTKEINGDLINYKIDITKKLKSN